MTANTMFRLDATTGNVLDKFVLEDSKLNKTRTYYYGSDYSNIFGVSGTGAGRASGWSGGSTDSKDDNYPTKREGKGSVISMPTWKKQQGNEVKEPRVNMQDDGLDFFEDEFQQLDDSGIPMEERLLIWDELMEEDTHSMLYSLPLTMVPDYDDHSDFYETVEKIKESYDFYTGQKFFKN